MNALRKIGPWIAIALVGAAMGPIVIGDWSRETTVGLSWNGRAIIAAVFVAGSPEREHDRQGS